jgi:hypothetical protein
METKPESIFTAAEIARVLACSRQNVHRQLACIVADGEKIAAGNLAKAWTLGSLPASIVRQLSVKAEAKGYRTTAALLAEPFTRFEAPFPLPEMARAVIERAGRLRNALQGIVALAKDSSVSASDLTTRGLASYKREFGNQVSAKHWRALLDRTIERDNGAEEWTRLELYIEENPARISRHLPITLAREKKLEVLEDMLASLQGSTALTPQQSVYFWTKSCDQLQLEIDAGAKTKKAKRAILQVLEKSGFVGTDFHSIRRNFDRKWRTYLTGGGRLQDGRAVRYEKTNEIVGDEDREKLIARGLDCGGRVSQAFRELFHGGELSPELTDRFIANPARKSYVPRSVRAAVASEVKRLMPLHHGPREHELRGPHNHRDFSGMFAGDSFQGDDCTCPVVYFEPDSSSRSGFRIIRGQLILMIDERSLLALGFALHSETNYNARIIRALITRVHDSYGLPRRRFYFERGIWKTSKILTGEKQPFATELELAHTELGLREFGVKFCHAKLPRGKVIERALGLVQNQMERVPGYVGRNEQTERFERVQNQINEARSGAVNPAKYFLNKEQWVEALARLLDNYNAERQEGKLLKGLSPLEAWNRFQSAEGLVRLGDKARYLLANHKLKLRVRRDGITLRPSLGGGTYCNETTGRLAGQDVLVWCNPEELGHVAVTSLDRKQLFVVPRLEPMPAIDATAEQMRRNAEQIDSHNEYARTAYRLISPHLVAHTFRKVVADAETLEIGERLEAGIRNVKAGQDSKRRNISKVQRLSRQLNMRPSAALANSATLDSVAEGFDLIAESRELRSAQKNISAGEGTAKVFVLDAPAKPLTTQQRHGMYWRLWKAVETAKPGLNRFALTSRVLGSVKKIAEMTDEEFLKVCHVFESIAKKEQKV